MGGKDRSHRCVLSDIRNEESLPKYPPVQGESSTSQQPTLSLKLEQPAMATAAVLSAQNTQFVSAKWRGLNDDEATQFVADATALLNDPSSVSQFEDNVKEVGTWANEVDGAFDRVTRTFADIVSRYGNDFRELPRFQSEWSGYNKVFEIITFAA